MDKKGYSDLISLVMVLVLIVCVSFGFYILTKDLENQVEALSKVVELQDKEILELHGKNAQLQEEINSLEIFDCTFKKFPELRDHYYNKAIEDALQ
ncbi:MAG: hypothetical protein SVK08_01780 [Halobacteriota archaeon]|nr:hypothetical protein [Halobacteriota archaeon]